MAIRNVKTEENPILRKRSRTVTEFNGHLFQLLDDMKDTLYKADGVGLAAPQVGVLKRVIVVDCGEEFGGFMELINPEIIGSDGEQLEDEACLSLPHKTGKTLRPMNVTVRAQDRTGAFFETKGSGLLARCFCHEIDHLDGVLFPDRLAPGEEIEFIKD